MELWLGERAEGDTYQCDTYSHALVPMALIPQNLSCSW